MRIESSEIKVALADDHAMVNDALATIIGSFDGYKIMLKAINGKELIDQLQVNNLPDLIILDINMPVMDGYDTARWLNVRYPHIKVVALTMFDSEFSTVRLIQLGVRGVVKKKMNVHELKRAIDTVVESGYYFSNNRLVTLLSPISSKILLANNIMLAENELLFLKLTCCDLTYKEIANEMGLSVRTVENYRDALFTKLNVKSRTGLVTYAIKNGVVSADNY
ncbi:MAG: response regulator transcription factor [Puia sp.]|nr:response regulator transcription factor [Puia sp.]